MKWSRYNILFQSRKFGWLLYNSGSNAFSQLDEQARSEVEKIRKDPEEYDFAANPGLYVQLKSAGYLVDDSQDDDLYNIIKMRRLSQDFASPYLALTIAPTRECNFACPYCYEPDRDVVYMSEKTENAILAFIRRFSKVNKIFITWYGGEPLLAFERILSLNNKLAALDIPYESVVITNGFLLKQNVIDRLDELKVGRIQITLDGSEETHNSRRFIIGGGKTYRRIIENLDLLAESPWSGRVMLRVNVDSTNEDEFSRVHKFIHERYGETFGGRIHVYPGYVHDAENLNPDTACYFDHDLKGRFLLKQYYEYGISDLQVFPSRTLIGCTAVRRNGYVIGPEGELYKCWNDMGIKEMVVGNVATVSDWNMGLIADYMVGSSFLNSDECKNCYFFPICDGGCPRVRLLNKLDGNRRDHCSFFKSHLRDLLELHYEQKLRQSDGERHDA